jgi:Fe-S-cluster containining protein
LETKECTIDLCTECCKTENHCCIMDIPFEIPNALFLISKGEEVGIKDLICREHPAYYGRVIICKNDTNGDISNQNCVFFVNQRCAIYEHRPDICRFFGTDFHKCRSMFMDEIPQKKIDSKTLNKFDDIAVKNSDINNYVNRVILQG